ncbi:MAG: hypothetical protein LIO55_01175, partial [Oscillospiraceae bacterium]|nr:hypothetical protein [Oscillospiraceae bacterium]
CNIFLASCLCYTPYVKCAAFFDCCYKCPVGIPHVGKVNRRCGDETRPVAGFAAKICHKAANRRRHAAAFLQNFLKLPFLRLTKRKSAV